MTPRIHPAALAILLAAILPCPAQSPESTGSPNQLVNPNPRDCCSCITTKVNLEEVTHEPDEDPARIYPEDNGNFLVPLDIKVNDGSSGNFSCDEVKIVKIVLRPRSGSSPGEASEVVVYENSEGTKSFVQTVTLPGDKVKSSDTQDWEVFVTCSGNAQVASGATVVPEGSCSYPFMLGGCMACLSGTCPAESGNNGSGYSMSIPVGSANAGDSAGSVQYQSNGTANPGPAGVTAFVPSNFTVNRDANKVITSIVSPVNTIEVAAAPTSFDPNAFTITHKHTATGTVFRSTTLARVQESSTTWLRSDSTFDGTTFRYQQKKEQNGATITWTMESGPVTGGTFSALRKEILQITEPQPGTRIHREKVQELDPATSSFVTVSDSAATWSKFAWGWEMTQQAVDPDGANLVSSWTYYQPGELSGPNGSTEGLGRVHTYTRHDGYQEVHTYWLNSHQVQQPFADQPQGLTILSEYNPATRTTTTTKTVGGNTLSKESESYNPTTNTAVGTTHTSANGTLVTTTVLKPYGQPFGGSPSVVTHPDGTLTTFDYTRHSDGGKTVVTTNGAGSGSTVTKGRKTTTTTNRYGTVIRSVTETIGYANNIVTDHSAVTSVDAFGRELATAYFPTTSSAADGAVQASASGAKWTTSTTYTCCGVATQTDQHGNETTHTYDSLRRQKTTTSLGITNETVHHGLTTDTHRYAAGGSAAQGNLVGRSSSNVANTQTSSWSPDPSSTTAGALAETTTATSYAGGITTTVTTIPGGASQTSKSYSDGRSYQTSGDLSPAMTYSYAVNATGMLTTSSYLDGTTPVETTTTQTDWAGRTLVTTKGPQTITQAYNNLGQLTSSTDADNVRTLFAYNNLGEQTTTAIDANGNGDIDFNGTDRISATTSEPGTYASTPVLTTTSSVYATNGNATATVVSTSHQTPDGLESWSVIPGVANPSHSLTTIGTNGAWTETITNPEGTSVKNTYSGGRLEKTESFTSGSTPALVTSISYLYDTLGRSWKSTDARTGTTTAAYVSATCDSVASVTDPGNRTTSFTYNSNGHRLTTTLPDTTVTHTSYYPSGEVKATWGSQTYPVYFTYDHAGRKLTMRTKPTLDGNGVPTNAGASLTTWNYSPVTGLLESKLDADGKGPSYTYTDAGRQWTRTWARPLSDSDPTKIKTTYGYTNGLLTTTTYNDGTPTLEFTYTRIGAQDTVKRGGTLHADYDYDSTTLALTTEKLNQDTAVARTLNRHPDPLGRPLSHEISGEYTTGYGYDSAGRLNRVWNHPTLDTNKAPTGNADFTYGYVGNSGGLVETVTGPVHTVTNAWESTRDVLATKTNAVNANNIPSSFDYGVNAIGQRETVGPVLSGGIPVSTYTPKWAWDYNERGELQEADDKAGANDRAYQFDAIGNREKTANGLLGDLPSTNNWTANALNQYTQANGVTLPTTPAPAPYDFDGNLRFDGGVNKDSENREYLWDAENRLIAVKRASDSTTLVTYAYDHLSRLIARTADGTTTYYLYDGWNRIEEFGGTALQKTYTWGMDLSGAMQGAGGVGGLLAVKSGSTIHYPTFDGNGNVTEYLASNGEVAAHFEYDAFGNVIATSGTPETFDFRFSSKPQDAVTGLYYYGYRWYDPSIGRWPCRDLAGESGGVNLQVMVSNDCVNRCDFLGLDETKKSKWFADGQLIQRVNETVEPYKTQGVPRDLGYIGWRDYSVTVDHGQYVIDDPVVKQSDGAQQRKAHEERHKASMMSDQNASAIPYKQVFCIRSKYFFIGWDTKTKGLLLSGYDRTKDVMNWPRGTGIKFTTWESYKEEESRETATEITELSALKNPPQSRIAELTKTLAKYQGVTNTGNTAGWQSFLDKYKSVMEKAKEKNEDFTWLDESKVYAELKSLKEQVNKTSNK